MAQAVSDPQMSEHIGRRWLELGCAVLLVIGLALGCFSGNWNLLGSPFPLDRAALMTGLVLAVGLQAVSRDRFASLVLVLLFISWIILGLLVQQQTVLPQGAAYAALDQVLVPFALFFAGPALARNVLTRRVFVIAISGIGLYCAITAIEEVTGAYALIVPGYIRNPSVGIHFGRARGPFLESVADGMVLVIAAYTLCLVAASSRTVLRKTAASLGFVLCLIGSFLTLTRAVWIAAVVAGLLLAFVARSTRRLLLSSGVALVSIVAVVVFLTPVGELVSSRGEDFSSVWDRLNTNAAAGRMLAANPLFGVGWGEAVNQMSQYVRLAPSYPVTAASAHLLPHSVFLARAAETGFVGISLWLAAIATVIFAVGRGVARGGVVGFWCSLALVAFAVWAVAGAFSPIAFALPNYLPFAVAGVGAHLEWTNRAPKVPSSKPGDLAQDGWSSRSKAIRGE